MQEIYESWFAAFHPIKAIHTKIVQTAVALELRKAPDGLTNTDFPKLTLYQASQLLEGSRKVDQQRGSIFSRVFGQGTPPTARTPEDQNRLAQGQLPKYPPDHMV